MQIRVPSRAAVQRRSCRTGQGKSCRCNGYPPRWCRRRRRPPRPQRGVPTGSSGHRYQPIYTAFYTTLSIARLLLINHQTVHRPLGFRRCIFRVHGLSRGLHSLRFAMGSAGCRMECSIRRAHAVSGEERRKWPRCRWDGKGFDSGVLMAQMRQ